MSSTQHTMHHNSLLMQQQQDESRLLREKYRQIDALYRYQSSRATSLEAKLDECINDKLQLQQENRKLKHDATRSEHSRAMDNRRMQAAANDRAEEGRAWEERPVMFERLVPIHQDEDDNHSAADEEQYHHPQSPAAPASPIRLGGRVERLRVDLTPAASPSHSHSPYNHPHGSFPTSTRWPAGSVPISNRADPRSTQYGASDTRPSYTSHARKYSTNYESSGQEVRGGG